MDLFHNPEFSESINEYVEGHKEFQLKVITTQDKLHNLLDEFDWEAFTLKIKHEKGYPTFKRLVDGIGFYSAANVEWQRRLVMARKQATKSALDAKQKSKFRQTVPRKFGYYQFGSHDSSSRRNPYDNPNKGSAANGGAGSGSGSNPKDGYKRPFNGHNSRD